MIDEADMDGDGEVSEAEFLRIMKKTEMFWSSLLRISSTCLTKLTTHRFYFFTSKYEIL